MWQCKKCNYKNSNSSEKCHGENCAGIRESDAHEVPIAVINLQQDKIETIEDYCPVCRKNQFFSKDSRKAFRWRWKCHGCHKLFKHKKDKKNKPKNQTILENTVIKPVEEDVV